jgi:hypothetical protein
MNGSMTLLDNPFMHDGLQTSKSPASHLQFTSRTETISGLLKAQVNDTTGQIGQHQSPLLIT